MFDELQLFRGKDFYINDYLTIHHPTLGEICDFGEQRYFNMVFNLCATPSDYKVMLWDELHTDWEEVDELDLFSALCMTCDREASSILFGDFPLQDLALVTNPQNGEPTLMEAYKDPLTKKPLELIEGGAVLDRAGYTLMTDFLRKVHNIEKRVEKSPTYETKMYLLDKERRRQKRQMHKKQKDESTLLPLVSALVNCEQFKYDHNTVWDLPLYAFMDSVRRIQKIKHYGQVVYGVMVDFDKMNKNELNWMGALE